MSEKKFYAGIGRRQLPDDIEPILIQLGYTFASQGWILRSGGADGADDAFEKGAISYAEERGLPFSEVMEIFLPWKKFNGRPAQADGYLNFDKMVKTEQQKALIEEMLETYHPAPEKLRGGVKKLMSRNCMQVLGADLATPSDLLVCWTHDGDANTHGAGFAKKVAIHHGVPTKDLFYDEVKNEMLAMIEVAGA